MSEPQTPAPPEIGSDAKWQEYLHWVNRFVSWDGYDATERDYKLEIGERLVAARAAFLHGDSDWLVKLRTAITKDNNLVHHITRSKFLEWCEDHPHDAQSTLRIIWDEDRPITDRFSEFVSAMEVNDHRVHIALSSLLHMALDPTRFPIFRAEPVSKAYTQTGYPDPHRSRSDQIAARYEHFLAFLDELIKRAEDHGVTLRDRLDAQSVVWSIAANPLPPDASDEEVQAFEQYRNPDSGTQAAAEVSSATTTAGVPRTSRDAILEAMNRFDDEDRDSDRWKEWELDHRHKWAIIYGDRTYPVKEMIARAAGTTTRGFSGGDEANGYLRSLGFTIERLRPEAPPRVWWVNQGATYHQERELGVIWAPQTNKSGYSFAHWRNLTEVQPGDVILHYANSALRAVSIATSPCKEAEKPGTIPEELWQREGYLVETAYTPLSPPISLQEIPRQLREGRPGGPFTKDGAVNQGYLFPAPDGLLPYLVHRFDVGWPGDLARMVDLPVGRLFKIAPGHGGSEWNDCHVGGYICVGWDDVGDLRRYDSFGAMEERFREAYGLEYQRHEPKILEKAQELWTLRELRPGDQVLANRGVSEIVGVGTVVQPGYEWLPDRDEMRHIVHVDWHDAEPRRIPRHGYWAFKTVLELPPDFLDQLDTVAAISDYEPPELDDVTATIGALGLRLSERTLRRYHLSLITRGFVILAGVSGTGKTWLAEAYAAAVSAEHKLVSVAPNWTTNEDLVGYFNPITKQYHDTPFSDFIRQAADAYHLATDRGLHPQPYHLILDEMNLARVEYYFASFLSAMEVRARHGFATMDIGGGDQLELTPNLFVVGTVNIDETTHGFTDKVWDRAQLVELDLPRGELAAHLAGATYQDDVLAIWDTVRTVGPFAYRVVDDIGTYVAAAQELGRTWQEALDEQILQKILPKLKGTNPAVGLVLELLVDLFEERYPLSYERARQMLEGFRQYGFASYFA